MLSAILIISGALALSGCPSAGCKKLFTIRGNVVDGSGNGIAGVNVATIDTYSYRSTIAITDSNGEYEVAVGGYDELGSTYVVFRKAGYSDFSTQSQPIGGGDGTCADQVIVRDAVLVQ